MHPGADEVIASYETDWRKVVLWLTGEVPQGKAIFFQKHMSHHLLPQIDRGWLAQVTSCLLIRHPREVLTSYLKVEGVAEPRVEDLGLPQQVEIFDLVRRQTGTAPPVLDARDLLVDPKKMLPLLCAALGVPFTDSMLSWPPGPRTTDGVWARHWYAGVERSTAFEPYRDKSAALPPRFEALYEKCLDYYEKLHEARLR
jgi:hypothetical protein